MSVAAPTRRSAPARHAAPPRHKKPAVKAVAPRKRRTIRPGVIAAGIVTLSLFTAVLGHALLAEGQLRLSHLQAESTAIQAVNRATVLKVSNLETPERIAQAAGTLHLVQPSDVIQLPAVSLNVPLPPIKIVGMP